MARPAKEISQKTFENLCYCQCSREIMCIVLDVTEKTLDKWCKSTYGKSFSLVFAEKREGGKQGLRAKMYQTAMSGNVTMMIYLSKNWLGMTDKLAMDHTVGEKIDLRAELEEYRKWKNDADTNDI